MGRRPAGVSTLMMPALVLLVVIGHGPGASAQAYKPPRTTDGRPDLQGVWQAANSAAWDLEDHSAQLGIPAGLSVVEGGDIPYTPEALAQRNRNRQARATEDPTAKCFLPGVPRATYMPHPFQILQSRGSVLIAYEYVGAVRQIYTSGGLHGQHPPEGREGAWMGDSRGHWDGDTLVVDVDRFNDQTWLDASGNFHSDALHVVERYTRTGPDHMRYEATIEDPGVFTRPWTIRMPLYRRQETPARLLEYYCQHDIDVAKGKAHEGGKK